MNFDECEKKGMISQEFGPSQDRFMWYNGAICSMSGDLAFPNKSAHVDPRASSLILGISNKRVVFQFDVDAIQVRSVRTDKMVPGHLASTYINHITNFGYDHSPHTGGSRAPEIQSGIDSA